MALTEAQKEVVRKMRDGHSITFYKTYSIGGDTLREVTFNALYDGGLITRDSKSNSLKLEYYTLTPLGSTINID